MADPRGNRRWGGLDNITAYRSRDCQEPVWSVLKKLDDKAEEGGFCVLLSELLPGGSGAVLYSSVMGTRTVPETDLSLLSIHDIPAFVTGALIALHPFPDKADEGWLAG